MRLALIPFELVWSGGLLFCEQECVLNRVLCILLENNKIECVIYSGSGHISVDTGQHGQSHSSYSQFYTILSITACILTIVPIKAHFCALYTMTKPHL